jgi:hypothetical protein
MRLVLATLATGHDDGGRVELHWDGASVCPDDVGVRNRLAHELGRTQARADEHVIARVTVVVAQTHLEARLALQTTAGQSERTMHAATCEEIEAAVALVVATTLDPFLDLRGPVASDIGAAAARPELRASPRPAESPAIEDQPTADVDEEELGEIVAIEEPPEPRPAISFVGSIGSGITGGLLNAPGPHIELLIGASREWLRLALVGHHAFARRRAIETVPDATVTLQAWGVGAIGCGVPGVRRIEVPLCIGVEGGRVRGEGRGDGLAFTSQASRAWLGVLARAGLHMGVTDRFWIAVDAHGDAIAWRPAFDLEGVGRVHLASRVAGRAIFGIGLRLP